MRRAVAYLPIGEGGGMVHAEVEVPARIAGGFVLVPVAELMDAWRACRSAPLGIGEFRAWLAAREMVARRCPVDRDRDRSPTYDVAELAGLLGVTEKRARASVRRLADAGLIGWSTGAIAFPGRAPEDGGRVVDSIGRGRGSVAVPRRVLRLLAGGARPALIAVALGLLLRCLSRRRGGFDGRGRIKAAWIARAFGVSSRQAKAARAELLAIGWIAAEDSDQWSMNRWGRAYRIDLGWSPRAATGGPTSSPPTPDPGPTSSPPDLQTRNPSGRAENQEPAPAADPAGTSLGGGGDREPEPAHADPAPVGALPALPALPAPSNITTIPTTSTIPALPKLPTTPTIPILPAPRLDDVRPEDLADTGRLLELHGQAVAKGLVSASEADRLRFAASAEHALAIGKANPAGLFAHLIRGRCWRYSTQADEDRANSRLKAHDRPRSSPAAVPAMTAPGLSEDARLVREVRTAMIRAGIYRDPWPAFSARNRGWDRGRWDAAMAELGLERAPSAPART